MNNKVTANDIEIVKEGLSFKEELELVAKRFDMTETQALEFIVNEVYKSNCFSRGLVKALELIKIYDDDYGNSYVPDDVPAVEDDKKFEEEPPF